MCVILPALNEADALEVVLSHRPPDVRVIVVDNGSTDGTSEVASSLGAEVIIEPRQGFGAACKAGLDATEEDIVVFMDADATCDWNDLPHLTEPISSGRADLALGRRVRSLREPGSMPFHVGVANALLGKLCGHIAATSVHDIPPFRAVRRALLVQLDIRDRTYGWPLEMVIRAGRAGAVIEEVPVRYRARIGRSKVTGTLRGTIRATARMLCVLWSYRK